MTDKIGVLGEGTAVTVATTTIYTVPAGKCAKGRFHGIIQGGAGGATTLALIVNGITVATKAAITASNYTWTTTTVMFGADSAALPDGLTALKTAAPAPFDYYLNEGDTVAYAVGGAAAISINWQFVGAEIDVD